MEPGLSLLPALTVLPPTHYGDLTVGHLNIGDQYVQHHTVTLTGVAGFTALSVQTVDTLWNKDILHPAVQLLSVGQDILLASLVPGWSLGDSAVHLLLNWDGPHIELHHTWAVSGAVVTQMNRSTVIHQEEEALIDKEVVNHRCGLVVGVDVRVVYRVPLPQ